jgi:hypothetical protein
MRYVPTEGISVAELQPLTGISNKGLNTWLTRLGKWWGYLEIEGQGFQRPIEANRAARNHSTDDWRPEGHRSVAYFDPLSGNPAVDVE